MALTTIFHGLVLAQSCGDEPAFFLSFLTEVNGEFKLVARLFAEMLVEAFAVSVVGGGCGRKAA